MMVRCMSLKLNTKRLAVEVHAFGQVGRVRAGKYLGVWVDAQDEGR